MFSLVRDEEQGEVRVAFSQRFVCFLSLCGRQAALCIAVELSSAKEMSDLYPVSPGSHRIPSSHQLFNQSGPLNSSLTVCQHSADEFSRTEGSL